MSSYDITVIGGGAIGFGTVLGLQRKNPYLKIALIEKGLQDPVIKVGNLNAKRNFTDVRDIVRAYHLAMNKSMKI